MGNMNIGFTVGVSNLLPLNTVVMVTDTTKVPSGFTAETSLNGKYLRGIPTAATNPGTGFGNANHQHTSSGNHSHSTNSVAHTHTCSSGGGGNANDTQGGGTPSASAGHGHNNGTSSSSGSGTVTTEGGHTHDAQTNDLEHRTVAFYKYTDTSIHMKRRTLPRNILFFYQTTTLPTELVEDTAYRTKHIKGNATPGTNSGSNSHTHDNQSHNHTVDMAAHTHTGALGTGVGSASSGTVHPGWISVTHTHAAGSTNSGARSSTSGTAGTDAGHTHGSKDHQPAFRTVKVVEVNSVSLRRQGVPENVIAVWVDTISLIPTGFQVADGTNGSINMLARYPKGDATPDNTGGSNTHIHAADSANHSHTGASVPHSHNSPSGTFSVGSPFNANGLGGLNVTVASGNHTHPVGSFTGSGNHTITPTSSATNHTHNSLNSEPVGVEVGFIVRNTT